jgi:hypothetical protein
MFFGLFKHSTTDELESEVNNVNISADGIVSLNLESKDVQKKVHEQVLKLKQYGDKLVTP